MYPRIVASFVAYASSLRLHWASLNQLLQVAQKCQSTLADVGSEGVSSQDLQTNSNMVVTAGHQLAKSLELQSLIDLGFSKRYVSFCAF
ncbi:probable transcriptional regulator SLK3 [Beta vulgaris subsp. vulgaris]|uniref:probable transcriptional regulator SLK3 n=1 Tax=Beta vulgaris subsp. vulgaris TaxID=3555 RepID=UPI0005400FF2|nr:probable transcriptional regulator SLK3 [Beta vulgaris subsp. vulgaris]